MLSTLTPSPPCRSHDVFEEAVPKEIREHRGLPLLPGVLPLAQHPPQLIRLPLVVHLELVGGGNPAWGNAIATQVLHSNRQWEMAHHSATLREGTQSLQHGHWGRGYQSCTAYWGRGYHWLPPRRPCSPQAAGSLGLLCASVRRRRRRGSSLREEHVQASRLVKLGTGSPSRWAGTAC